MATLTFRQQPFHLRLSPEPFSSTYHWSTHLYSTRSFKTGSRCSELPNLQKTLDDHSKRIALDVNIPQHLQSGSSFRPKAEELSTLLPPDLQHRQNITHFPSPIWQQNSSFDIQISTSVAGITGRTDHNNLKRQCGLSIITSYQADYVIYTDESASGGTINEGAAAVLTRRSLLQPVVVTTIKAKGRTFTSPYEEEAAAMESAFSGHSTTQPLFNHRTLL